MEQKAGVAKQREKIFKSEQVFIGQLDQWRSRRCSDDLCRKLDVEF